MTIQRELLDDLQAATTAETKAALVAESVLEALPNELSAIARRCAFLPWFTARLVRVLTSQSSEEEAEEITSTISRLLFVEKLPWGLTYHSSTREGLISKYAREDPTEIIETWQRVLPVLLEDWDDDESAIAALYGLMITSDVKQAGQRLDDLMKRFSANRERNRLLSVFEAVDEAEKLPFVPELQLTAEQWNVRGLGHFLQGEFSQSLEDISHAVRLDSENPGYL